jgi:tRNA(Ile)-lysidine synthase
MLAKIMNFIAENKLIRHGENVLLTVSGGIDSMVMANLFLHLPYKTGIAHCNFSLRGEESDGDENLVRAFAEKNGIPFFSVRFDTKNYAKDNGISVQMSARELRYSWFEEIRKSNNYDFIAVAHNLNDKIETLLINLTRGTGLTGLSGIKPVSDRIIRPLLFATRESIASYCMEHAIAYREDKSNADTKYIRNKIRHLVIPVLKEINPSIENTLSETAERFAGINEIVNSFVSELRNKITESNEKRTIVKIVLLKEYLHNKSLIFELFRIYGITNYQLDDLLNVINGRTGSQIITDSHRIIRNRNEIIIEDNEKSTYDVNKRSTYRPHIANNPEQLSEIPGIISAEQVNVDESFKISSDPSDACLDFEKIKFPLLIRRWKAGDYFFPLGMKKKKKLSDYFIDKKYSLTEKENKTVLESDGNIIWIIGDRIDDRFRITDNTKTALLIKSKDTE